MLIRRVSDGLPDLLQLQEAILVNLLRHSIRTDSCRALCSGAIRADDRDAAVVVARTTAHRGYACSQARIQPPSRIAAMIATFGRLTYLGTTDRCARMHLRPVCVDRAWRGRGVLRGLIVRMKDELAGQYEGPQLHFQGHPRSLARTWTAWG